MLSTALRSLRQQMRRWMQRVAGPEPQPILLPQRRVYVLPTAAGLGVVVMLCLMLLAAVNYNLSLAYAFTFLIAGAGVAHILATWRNLVGLRIAVQADGECFAGDAARFRVTLDSLRPGERHAIHILDESGQLLLEADDVSHAARHDALLRPANRRGLMPVGRLTLETRYPLGWVRAWSYIEPDAQALVYPQPAGDLPRSDSRSTRGTQEQALIGGGEEEFAGLRERRPSDPPSRIAWRRTARDGELLVKDFHALAAEEGLIDWHALPAWMDTEARLSQLTQWLLQAQAQHARLSLRLPDGTLGPDSSPQHYQACLARLALFGLDDAGAVR
ncbi:MAG: DUF58 domain-containing protein [Rhodocyclaceae bacterium]